ncbi:DUF5994 family protein [Mycobacterium avium]|uniref:DUF5994 family protein n=1 Tax=Mycobacterium avium TaxID=1764 RepID=UPI002F262247
MHKSAPGHNRRHRSQPYTTAGSPTVIKVRPRSDDLMTELPGLIAVLSIRLGAISCVMYNNTEWRITPDELLSGGRVVQLDGCHGQPPNTVEVLASKGNKLVLLVVPYHIDPDQAHGIVMAAAAPGDASNVDTLLMISVKDRESRTKRDAARERWDSQCRAKQRIVGIDPRPWGRSSGRLPSAAIAPPSRPGLGTTRL